MDKPSQPEKSGWWLAYFIVMVVLYAGSVFVGPHTPARFLVLVFNGFGLVGLWGYLSDSPIGLRQFWIAYACLMFLGATVTFGPGLWHGVRRDSTLFVLLALAAAFSVPGWLAIWRYAFRSPHVWQTPQAAA